MNFRAKSYKIKLLKSVHQKKKKNGGKLINDKTRQARLTGDVNERELFPPRTQRSGKEKLLESLSSQR